MIPQATLDRITPAGCAEYCRRHGWQEKGTYGIGTSAWWRSPCGREAPLPTDPTLSDCKARLAIAARACADTEHRCECRVADDMARLSEGKDPLPSAEAWAKAVLMYLQATLPMGTAEISLEFIAQAAAEIDKEAADV